MRAVGVVCEYDPFHNGHLHHINSAKNACGADACVCVMSGAFLQRGEPAMFSSRDRARMALACGADIVLGMPFANSAREAENFALGGVFILHSLGIVTHLSFGCETEDFQALQRAAHLLEAPDDKYLALLREALASGMPLAAAQGLAAERAASIPGDMLKRPNNALAVCYLRALARLHSPITPVPVYRSTDYHGERSDTLASASAVRAAFLRGDWHGARRAMPEAAFDIASEAIFAGRTHKPGALDAVLIAKLLAARPEDFSGLPEISEGLENRLLRAAERAATRETLIAAVKTRRYTRARISRALCHALVGARQEDFAGLPGCARLLGFRKTALPLLSGMAKGGFPIITKAARDKRLALDMRAEELWMLGAGLAPGECRRQEIIVE